MLRRKLKVFVQLLIRLELRGILQRISKTLPFSFFRYNRIIILELEERKKFRKYEAATLRQATEKNLEPLARCLGRAKPELKKRWERKDICFLAEANGSAVSATWVSFQKYRLDEVDYIFDPGANGIFLYDSYTVPEWRLKGIHVNVMQYLLDCLLNHSVEKVYSAIEHGNDLSLRTHLRFGFKVAQHITHVKVFGFRWHLVKSLSVRKSEFLFNQEPINLLNLKNVRK